MNPAGSLRGNDHRIIPGNVARSYRAGGGEGEQQFTSIETPQPDDHVF